jgi:hypothetical protein
LIENPESSERKVAAEFHLGVIGGSVIPYTGLHDGRHPFSFGGYDLEMIASLMA